MKDDCAQTQGCAAIPTQRPCTPLHPCASTPQAEGLPAGAALHGRFASPATVSALSHCELYTLAAEDFERVAAQHPEAAPQLEQAALRCAAQRAQRDAPPWLGRVCVGLGAVEGWPCEAAAGGGTRWGIAWLLRSGPRQCSLNGLREREEGGPGTHPTLLSRVPLS